MRQVGSCRAVQYLDIQVSCHPGDLYGFPSPALPRRSVLVPQALILTEMSLVEEAGNWDILCQT